MPELIFDLVGPFVVQFEQGNDGKAGKAYVYAPLCANHHANILTDTDDVFVPGHGDSDKGDSEKEKYVYKFVDDASPKGNSKYNLVDPEHERRLLIVHIDVPPLEGKKDQCHLVLEIPCPDYVIPLLAEQVWIHKNTARNCWVTHPDRTDIVDSKRARGLRFIYKNCPNMPEINVPAKYRGKDFSSKTLGVSKEPHYTMSLRFVEAGERSAGQADAYSCFHNSRAMWSPSSTSCDLSKWRVDFDDLQNFNIEVGGQHPHDCHAPVVVMQNWSKVQSDPQSPHEPHEKTVGTPNQA